MFAVAEPLRRISRRKAQRGRDLCFGRGCFSNEQAQRLCGVFQKPVAKRPLAIDETADCPLVYAQLSDHVFLLLEGAWRGTQKLQRSQKAL